MLYLLALAYQGTARVAADEYTEHLRDFLITACQLVPSIPVPREDRILDLVPPSLKVPRSTL